MSTFLSDNAGITKSSCNFVCNKQNKERTEMFTKMFTKIQKPIRRQYTQPLIEHLRLRKSGVPSFCNPTVHFCHLFSYTKVL